MNYLEAGIEVISLIENSGYEAFFVGGMVRDYLLDMKPNDIDIATNALPDEIANIFEVVNTGIKFNSVTIVYKGYHFETTTYRVEFDYKDNRHPTYKVASSLVEDLKRRDFTINAMAMDKEYKIIDIFDGQKDLNDKLIQTVYDPVRRFTEDALRMLRACYFAAKLDFKIAEETLSAIKKCSHLVQYLSNDRIMWELEKIINSKNPMIGLKYLQITNILPYLLLFNDGINILLEYGACELKWSEFLAVCFYNFPDKLSEIHLKSGLAKEVKEIIELAKKSPKNEFSVVSLFEYGEEISLSSNIVNVYYLKAKSQKEKIINKYQNLAIHSMSELAIKGKDIIDEVALKNNRIINDILLDVRDKVLLNKLENDKECIVKYIKKQYS